MPANKPYPNESKEAFKDREQKKGPDREAANMRAKMKAKMGKKTNPFAAMAKSMQGK